MKPRNWVVLSTTALILSIGMFSFKSTARGESLKEQHAELIVGHIKLYRNLLGLIQDFRNIAADPATAGVAAVMGVEDHVPQIEDRIKFLERMLPTVDDAIVRRAIQLKLLELYKNHNAPEEKRTRQLQSLMTGQNHWD